jgi:oligoribonuclease (3'-5' exoribonuclease)
MTNAVFLDLETTGTNEYTDPILEVGIVVADTSDWRTTSTCSWLIRPVDPEHTRLSISDVVWQMHQDNGLWDECLDSGARLDHVEQDVRTWLWERCGDDEPILLAGSGVAHFDRRFLKAQMPALDAMFTYYTLDVGVLRRACEFAERRDLQHPTPPGDKTHRALEDAMLHLDEWRHYRRVLQSVVPHSEVPR